MTTHVFNLDTIELGCYLHACPLSSGDKATGTPLNWRPFWVRNTLQAMKKRRISTTARNWTPAPHYFNTQSGHYISSGGFMLVAV